MPFASLASVVTALALSAPAVPPASTAIFAGGCFWCMETAFEGLPGVLAVTSGYVGGSTANPTYNEVSAGKTGHAEAVQVTYDSAATTYEKLLAVFWRNVDPFSAGGQFCDRGSQYRAGIFHLDEGQRQAAEASRAAIAASLPGKVVTEVTRAGPFYVAEEYHQDFYKKNPARYRSYRAGCGRDARLRELWGASGH